MQELAGAAPPDAEETQLRLGDPTTVTMNDVIGEQLAAPGVHDTVTPPLTGSSWNDVGGLGAVVISTGLEGDDEGLDPRTLLATTTN